MRIRAFTRLPASVLMIALLVVPIAPGAEAADRPVGPVAPVAATDEGDTTRPTINEFFPEERPLSDCLSSLPKPNCGSEARGGWAQTTVFLAILAGLVFIAWRIVASSRRSRREARHGGAGPDREVTGGTRDATTAPDGDDGVPAP